MLHNAFAYVARKFFKSIVIFLIILLMASLSLVGLSIKERHVVLGISRVKISKKSPKTRPLSLM